MASALVGLDRRLSDAAASGMLARHSATKFSCPEVAAAAIAPARAKRRFSKPKQTASVPPTTYDLQHDTYMVQRPLGRMTEGRSVRSVLLWHCQFTKNFGFDRELSMGTSSVSSCGCMKPRRQPSRQRLAAIKVHYLRCNQSSGREDQNECWILGRLAPAQARRAAPASIWHDFRGRWRQTSPR